MEGGAVGHNFERDTPPLWHNKAAIDNGRDLFIY